MKNLIVIICLMAISILGFASECHAQFQWNPRCALESAQVYSSCRASGGGNFRCLVGAGFHYWQCSGSSFARGRVRAAITGARAVRRSR